MVVNTVWYVSRLLFFYSRCPPCPGICKNGGGGKHAHMPYGVGDTARCRGVRMILNGGVYTSQGYSGIFPKRSRGRKSLSGVQGQNPGRESGVEIHHAEADTKCEISKM